MKRARARFPDSLVLIFAMIVAAQILTYVLPAGAYERVDGRVVAGSYRAVEAEPLRPWHALTSIFTGMQEASEIIFMVFIVGGSIGVIRATGALDALIGWALRVLGGRPGLLIAGMTALFSLGSATIGMAEEYVPFIPILVTLCLALRMDALVAVGIVYAGAGIGYACSALNPFTVVIAQGIAGLEITSGSTFRWVLLPICLVVGVQHVVRYARRVRRDPRHSLVRDVDYSDGFHMPEGTRFSAERTLVLVVFVAGIALFVWGVKELEWYLVELATIFFAMGLVAAVASQMGANRAAEEFCKGAAELTTTALLIGFARAIKVVLDEGQVIDTVIHGIAEPLGQLGPGSAAVGMFVVQCVCNFFIPSGSGQAYVTMPIMAPLADLTGLTRQVAVLAYQFGDGFTNMIVPTNAVLMGMLGLARIPYQRWLRFILPLVLELFVVLAIALLVAVRIGYS